MKKLLLVLGVLIGLTVQSYALTFPNSTNKTSFQKVLTSSLTNGNTAFTTGTTNVVVTGGNQTCGTVASSAGVTDGTLLSCGATPITGIMLSGGASGGTVAIYDAQTNIMFNSIGSGLNTLGVNEVGPLEVVFEATVAANTATFVDLHDVPINTNTGVVALATSTSGVIVYTGNGAANQ